MLCAQRVFEKQFDDQVRGGGALFCVLGEFAPRAFVPLVYAAGDLRRAHVLTTNNFGVPRGHRHAEKVQKQLL